VSRRDNDKIVVELPGLNEKEFGKAKEKLAQTGLLHFKIVEYDQSKSSAFFSKVRARLPRKEAWPAELKGLEEHKVFASGNIIRSTSRDILEYMVGNALDGDQEHLVGYEKIYADPQDSDLSEIRRLSKLQEKQIDREQDFNPNSPVVKTYQVYYLRMEGMSGENVEDASVGYDTFQRPVTNMRFSSSDATEFANLTERNVNRAMAILIDDMVYSAPNINERIGGGRVQISMGGGGNSIMKEAEALAAVLKSGALQAPLRQLYSSQVGPTLGKDSIEAGKISIIVGFIFVILFMILYYKQRGMVANVALLLNLLFIAAGLALFGATLTLPGIAGIVFTVGMVVDANVFIFERMKEEERKRSVTEAFAAGYEKAWSAILDANITTGIAAFVLYQFGTGPIKGFAVTLGLGIISSMYTAIVVTRLIFEYLYNREQSAKASA
jgi:protein-export membrane protein SecD